MANHHSRLLFFCERLRADSPTVWEGAARALAFLNTLATNLATHGRLLPGRHCATLLTAHCLLSSAYYLLLTASLRAAHRTVVQFPSLPLVP